MKGGYILMGNRDEFSRPDKELLAKRVGYKCSNPKCRKPTIGPQKHDEKTINIGVAAHICAAASGGKRYKSKMTSQERSNINNGIWLCWSCATLIDRDEKYYTVELLSEWKKQAEADAHLAIEGYLNIERSNLEKISKLFDSEEYDKAMDELRNLEVYKKNNFEEFFVNLYIGKIYVEKSMIVSEKTKKESFLINALRYLEKAEKNKKVADKNEVYDLYIFLVMTYIELGRLENEEDFYLIGISKCEDDIEFLIKNEIENIKKYRLILDYALLLDEASQYLEKSQAIVFLKKEYTCYLLINKLEDLLNVGVDYDTAFRLFNNAGRCCEQLIQFESDLKMKKKYLSDAIELYKNALDNKLSNLHSEKKRYAMAYRNLGNVYMYAALTKMLSINYCDAIECYEKSIRAYELLKDDVEYYKSLSNKARALCSVYKESEDENVYNLAEQLLLNIIDKRITLEDIKGSYNSRIQLAQLYTVFGECNSEVNKIKASTKLFNEILEYYTEEYMPMYNIQILYGKYDNERILHKIDGNQEGSKLLIEEILQMLINKKYNISFEVRELYIELISKIFFEGTSDFTYEGRYQLYNNIAEQFKVLNIDINNYIHAEF